MLTFYGQSLLHNFCHILLTPWSSILSDGRVWKVNDMWNVCPTKGHMQQQYQCHQGYQMLLVLAPWANIWTAFFPCTRRLSFLRSKRPCNLFWHTTINTLVRIWRFLMHKVIKNTGLLSNVFLGINYAEYEASFNLFFNVICHLNIPIY